MCIATIVLLSLRKSNSMWCCNRYAIHCSSKNYTLEHLMNKLQNTLIERSLYAGYCALIKYSQQGYHIFVGLCIEAIINVNPPGMQ